MPGGRLYGNAFHRRALAHYMADTQDDVGEELEWDLRALTAADSVSDERAKDHHASLAIPGFYPSPHLNVADAYRGLGDTARAREHLALGRASVDALNDDGYGALILGGLDRLAARLKDGDTSAIPPSPQADATSINGEAV